MVGDGHVWVGIGKGKAAEVPVAISKAVEQAKKHLVHVPLKGGSIPHEVHGLFGGEHVLLKPAVDGTGIIAGGPFAPLLSWWAHITSLQRRLGVETHSIPFVQRLMGLRH